MRQTEVKRENLTRIPLFDNEPRTLGELFRRAAQEKPRSDALNYKKNGAWQSISSAEMIRRAENIALGFYALGIRRGDRVALWSANCPEWTLADAGCQFAGIIDVPVYTTLAAAQVAYILKDSGARMLVVEKSFYYERLKDFLPEIEGLEKFVFINSDGVSMENALSLEDLEKLGAELRGREPQLIDELVKAVEPKDVSTIIYTSGTTGEPKGVMLAHSNNISNLIDTCEFYGFSPKDIPLSVLPLSHVYERGAMYLYIWNGMKVYYAESIEKAADNLREVRPTMFVGVPRIFEKVYAKAKDASEKGGGLKARIFAWAVEVAKEHARKMNEKKRVSRFLAIKHSIADKFVFSKLREVFGGRLRFCITGGAALSEDIGLTFMGAGIPIMQGYGLTETSPVISSNNPLHNRIGTVGKLIRNVEVKIAEDGEILVKGANVMQGYYNKPDATRDAFTPDGFFKTGDIGEFDSDGFLKITDRKKELFKTSGGKYIAPAPIEQMIKASRFVNQVVLIGNGRKFPAALIVPDFEQLKNYAQIKNLDLKTPAEFCQHPKIIDLLERQIDSLTQNLSQFEKVKRIALLENELTIESGELTPTLKVKRRIVDEKYREIIEKIYTDAEK